MATYYRLTWLFCYTYYSPLSAQACAPALFVLVLSEATFATTNRPWQEAADLRRTILTPCAELAYHTRQLGEQQSPGAPATWRARVGSGKLYLNSRQTSPCVSTGRLSSVFSLVPHAAAINPLNNMALCRVPWSTTFDRDRSSRS